MIVFEKNVYYKIVLLIVLSQNNVLSELPKAFKIINDGTRNNTEVPVAKDDITKFG